MRLLVHAPGRSMDDVLEVVEREHGVVLFQSRRKAMLLVDVPGDRERRLIRLVGGNTWTSDLEPNE